MTLVLTLQVVTHLHAAQHFAVEGRSCSHASAEERAHRTPLPLVGRAFEHSVLKLSKGAAAFRETRQKALGACESPSAFLSSPAAALKQRSRHHSRHASTAAPPKQRASSRAPVVRARRLPPAAGDRLARCCGGGRGCRLQQAPPSGRCTSEGHAGPRGGGVTLHVGRRRLHVGVVQK